MGWVVLVLVGAVFVGNSIGWTRAQARLAEDCQKLGQFYLDGQVFDCAQTTQKLHKSTHSSPSDS